jgi:hypothetical protein
MRNGPLVDTESGGTVTLDFIAYKHLLYVYAATKELRKMGVLFQLCNMIMFWRSVC